MNESSEESLKEAALHSFILRIKPKVISNLTHWVDRSQAEDIFQEAIYKIFLLAEENPSEQAFIEKLEMLSPMLFKIAKNKAISDQRHCRVEQNYRSNYQSETGSVNREVKTQSIESELIINDESQLLLEAINSLPPICRQVFVQRKISGKSHAQIAALLNISTKTVESHIAKGLKQCRAFMLKKQFNSAVNIPKKVS